MYLPTSHSTQFSSDTLPFLEEPRENAVAHEILSSDGRRVAMARPMESSRRLVSLAYFVQWRQQEILLTGLGLAILGPSCLVCLSRRSQEERRTPR